MVNDKVGRMYTSESTEIDGQTYVRVRRIGNQDSARCTPTANYQKVVSDAETLKGIAAKVVHGYRNFVHANDREDMRRFDERNAEQIACEAIYSGKEVPIPGAKQVLGRAKRLKERVPGIFKPEYETSSRWVSPDETEYHKFPTVDSIANIASRRPRFDSRLGNPSYSGATHEDSILFLSQVISSPFYNMVRAEVLEKVDSLSDFSSEESRDSVMRRVGEVVDSLREDLKGFGDPGIVRVYTGDNVDVKEIVRHPFWYTGFTEASVSKMLVDYWAAFSKDALDSNKSVEDQMKGTAEKVAKLFPDCTPNLNGLENRRRGLATSRLEASIAQEISGMIGSGDYSKINPGMLNNARTEDARRLKEGLVSYIKTKEVPIGDFDGARARKDMLREWSLPMVEELNDFYDRALADAFIGRLKGLGPVERYKAAVGFGGKSDWSKIALEGVEAIMRDKDFQEQLVQQYALEAQRLDNISLGAERTRSRYNGLTTRLIDRIGVRMIENSDSGRFVELVNGMSQVPHRTYTHTRRAIGKRVLEMIGESLDQGIPFATAAKKAGFEKPEGLRVLIKKSAKVNS